MNSVLKLLCKIADLLEGDSFIHVAKIVKISQTEDFLYN